MFPTLPWQAKGEAKQQQLAGSLSEDIFEAWCPFRTLSRLYDSVLRMKERLVPVGNVDGRMAACLGPACRPIQTDPKILEPYRAHDAIRAFRQRGRSPLDRIWFPKDWGGQRFSLPIFVRRNLWEDSGKNRTSAKPLDPEGADDGRR